MRGKRLARAIAHALAPRGLPAGARTRAARAAHRNPFSASLFVACSSRRLRVARVPRHDLRHPSAPA
ncbi:hypothetical protein AXF42_Ash005361 [Apostasia shenzhenica]|uniref:Uncharacterized protein n=1 Tax=Apostasia shenzhenica TaxID=1088818 RepID=A0A2I0B6N8_9ASPA|nr:hypothetical protein AXF42_Ash005361 [Apostasia shenzhenica]